MTDMPAAETSPEVTETTGARIFKIGSARIVEDESTVDLTNKQVQAQLVSQYPEVKNATIREVTVDNQRVVEFLPQPGRKG